MVGRPRAAAAPLVRFNLEGGHLYIRVFDYPVMSELNKYGMGFWVGGGVYSIINMIMNYDNAARGDILFYNYLITGVAVLGLTLNMILLKRDEK
jgi:hypothetical protein